MNMILLTTIKVVSVFAALTFSSDDILPEGHIPANIPLLGVHEFHKIEDVCIAQIGCPKNGSILIE